jgi:hypothetical protein
MALLPHRLAIPLGLAVGLAGCAGTAHQVEIGPPPAKQTSAVLAGNLCQDNRCRCRDESGGDGGAGVPESPGRKRFEIRLGPSPYELWLTVNQSTVLYKSLERPEECFYLDLPSGEQHLELRASNPEGVSVGVAIHELGTQTRSWYDTFKFACGVPGVCSYDELESNKAQYTGVPHQIYDRCGTTQIKGLSWDHGKAPDQEHPSELVVRFTLAIHKLEATKPHGDDTCLRGGKHAADAPEL